MEQEKVINRILRDMKMADLVDEESKGYTRFYLNLVWAAAWEESRKETYGHGSKPIAQVDKKGQIVNIFRSTVEAARKTGYTKDAVFKALQRQSVTRQGWTWRYI